MLDRPTHIICELEHEKMKKKILIALYSSDDFLISSMLVDCWVDS